MESDESEKGLSPTQVRLKGELREQRLTRHDEGGEENLTLLKDAAAAASSSRRASGRGDAQNVSKSQIFCRIYM